MYNCLNFNWKRFTTSPKTEYKYFPSTKWNILIRIYIKRTKMRKRCFSFGEGEIDIIVLLLTKEISVFYNNRHKGF